MRQTSLAASGLVIAIMAVVLLIGVTLNANAASKANLGTTSILGPAGLGSASALTAPGTTASIGLMAGTVMFVIGGVGGLWLVVSRGVGYFGRRRAASAVPALRQTAVPAAVPVSPPLTSTQSSVAVESAPVQAAPVQEAPVQAAPAQEAMVQAAQVQAAAPQEMAPMVVTHSHRKATHERGATSRRGSVSIAAHEKITRVVKKSLKSGTAKNGHSHGRVTAASHR